ncbi:SPFH domain-containing protein [Photobacterium aphoticum]|uniref:Band 7 domain-containing protein n=2 Tax=Photobacterium aphoticum TaxID=754436 RepID=A0A0J1GHI9_9GAMM|nr:SPFH domain-containing protein [Photobacterium aphoticum]KLU99164.1 hypothetical protein ABT58_19350 [Photobacterium aphoticum]PSU59046.1 NrtR-regulated NrtX [Photobacterium aphoticum]GHA45078.1 hypothetical protein GCM10007086_18260 [Photobacterium aphoticum]
MFGITFFKADPSTYVMLYKNGKLTKQGTGINFYYHDLGASLLAIPLNSQAIPFAFAMKSKDYQNLTVQGQVTYRIAHPDVAANMLNFTVDKKGQYLCDDPEKIQERVVRAVQVLVRNEMEERTLVEGLRSAKVLSREIQESLPLQVSLTSIGIEVSEFSVTNIQPSPEATKALEAEAREEMLKQADNAIYSRRLASIQQEQQVKERELDTEQAVNAKQQMLEKQKLEAKREQQRQQFSIEQEKIAAQTQNEQERAQLVDLENSNNNARADANAYSIERTLKAYEVIDSERLKIMSQSGLAPEQLIAQAIENLTRGDNKVGSLNFSPELLQMLTKH